MKHSFLMVDDSVNLLPLFSALRDARVGTVWVSVELPPAPYRYVPGNVNTPAPELGQFLSESFYTYQVNLQNPPEQSAIRIAFGYTPEALAKRFGALGILFVFPIMIAVWKRIRDSHMGSDEKAAMRYGAMRTINALSLFLPLAWYMCYSATGCKDILKLVMSGSGRMTYLSVNLALLLGPPVVCLLVCTLTLAGHLRLEESGHKHQHLIKKFASLLLGTYLPWLFLLAGIDAMARRELSVFIGFLAAGQFVRMINKAVLTKDAANKIYPLMGNSLRAKILEIAARSGIAPREIYVLTEDAEKSANACATSKNTIVLNEFLIKRFTKREVDAVVGHEIGHLRLNHPKLLGFILYGGIAFAMFGSQLLYPILSLFMIAFHPLMRLLPYLYRSNYSYYIIIFIVLIFRQFIARRFEYSADAFSVTVTGDPEAMITSLAKLARLNLLPMSWARFDEGLFTHPSTLRRIHTIARNSGIPEYRLEQLLNSPEASEERYSLTDTATVPGLQPSFVNPVPHQPAAPYPDMRLPGPVSYPVPAPARVGAAHSVARKKSGLKVLIPFKYAPFTAMASVLLLAPGSPASNIAQKLAIPWYAVALLVAFITVVLQSIRLKRKLLAAHAKRLEFHPTSPESFEHLDRDGLDHYTAELERLGFQRIQDYTTVSDPPKALQGFERFFIHPSHCCAAGVAQVTAANRAVTKIACSISSRLDDDWFLSVSNREPKAEIYAHRNPKRLFRWLPASSVPHLLEEHLALRREVTSVLGINAVEPSLESALRRSGEESFKKRAQFKRTNILLYLLETDRFERNPKYEWLGDFEKIRRNRAKQPNLQYERA